MDLNEKTILPITSGLIQNCLKSANFKEVQAGYLLMGIIAEPCK